MNGDEWARLIYLGLLGAVLLSWYLVQNRGNLSTLVKQVGAWVFIFLGAIAVIGLWDDIHATVAPRQSVFASEGRVEIPRSPDGHYYLTLDVNGTPIRFVVDTGATGLVLSREDAAKAGIEARDLAFYARAQTANGEVRTAPVTLQSLRLGAFEDRAVPAFVNDGDLFGSLLGMSYLQRWSRIEIAGNEMILTR